MVAGLDAFANTVMGFCGSGAWDEAADASRKALKDTLPRHAGGLDGLLETLTYEKHSIPIVAILSAKLNAATSSAALNAILPRLKEASMSVTKEQVRHAVDVYTDLFRNLSTKLVERKEAAKGIPILRSAIQRLQANPQELTSLHCELCLLCLVGRNFRPALVVLEAEISALLQDSPKTPFPAKAFLLYYYYGGFILAVLRNFPRSLFFFEAAVTTPCTAVSAIMVEAYKKHILVSLIYHGKVNSLPKYTSTVVSRFIKPSASAHHDLATAYTSANPGQLKAVADRHTFHPTEMGLVREVLRSLYKRNIQRLTRTFLTLSLADVAGRAQLGSASEAEEYLVAMVADGEIFARIDHAEGMVYFHDDPNTYTAPHHMKEIEAHVERAMGLGALAKELDTELLLNPVYVQRLAKGAGGGGSLSSPAFHDDEGFPAAAPPPPAFSDFLAGYS